jgi:Ca2+-binding RTX toxin-like protein
MPIATTTFEYFGPETTAKDIASLLGACKKIARDGGSITSGLVHHDDGSVTTIFIYKDKNELTCGRMTFEGDPFGLDGSPSAAAATTASITGFSFSHHGNKVFSCAGLDPIDPADFYAMFLDINSFGTEYVNFLDLTKGGLTWQGSNADDTFAVRDGDNIITGQAGDDSLFKIDSGDVTFRAGAGLDRIAFYQPDGLSSEGAIVQKLVVNLKTGAGLNPYGGTLTLSGIEAVQGTGAADRIIGSTADNFLAGGGATTGRDVIFGKGGDDTISIEDLAHGRADGGAGFDRLAVMQSIDLTDPIFADLFTNFESYFVTSFGGDTLFARGDAGDNTFAASSGEDTFMGRGGNDHFDGGFAFKSDFTNGVDVAEYSGNRANYKIGYVDGILTVTDKRGGSPDGTDTMMHIEVLRFADKDVDVSTIPVPLLAGDAFIF